MGKDIKGKELGEGILQRKNGIYEGRFTDRFGKRRSFYSKNLRELKNKLSEEKAKDLQKSNTASPTIILDDWYEKWLRVYKEPVVRKNTLNRYMHLYNTKISPTLGKMRIMELTKLQVTDLFNQLKKQGYSWETINGVKILLGDLLRCAMEDEIVSRNVAKMARLPLNKPRKNVFALSIEDQDDFLECASGTFYGNLFVVAINSGLRPGELFALTEDDIDFNNMEINVDKTLLYYEPEKGGGKGFEIGPPKTKMSYRKVPINKQCENALRKQIMQKTVITRRYPCQEEGFRGFLFTTKFNNPLNTQIYGDAIKRVVNEMNLMRDPLDQMEPFFGHVFRHTFATRCFEAGIPPKTVQGYLGHASLAMTMDLYTDLMDNKKHDDMKKLDAFYENRKDKIVKFVV